MPRQREFGAEHPGIKWGIFTARIPLLHTRVEWPDLLQGVFVAGATGLATVPVLTNFLGLSFEEAVACMFIQSFLLCSAPIFFGEPFAPGMVTPALPLMIAAILVYPEVEQRWQFLTAAAICLAAILFVLGITGLGRRFIAWLPDALKGGIILGAAIAALLRVFVHDFERFFLPQPVTTTVALGVCMLLIFSVPVQRWKRQYRWLALLAGLGLLPGFIAAAIVGPLVGPLTGYRWPSEITFEIESGFILLPFADLLAKTSPFSLGLAPLEMWFPAFMLALMTYVILFGDIITGTEIIKTAEAARPDEKIDINTTRSHISLAIRNALQGLTVPFFPYQGSLWTGVHVVIVQRWSEGRKSMDSIFSGIHSYYVFGLPLLYFVRPAVTALEPLMTVALSLTLILTGFACAYVAMEIPKTTVERGVVLFTAVCLAIFQPWVGMLIGVVAAVALVGIKPHVVIPPGEKIP